MDFYPPLLSMNRGSFPHRIDALDRHKGQRDKLTNEQTDGKKRVSLSVHSLVSLSLRWSFTLDVTAVEIQTVYTSGSIKANR